MIIVLIFPCLVKGSEQKNWESFHAWRKTRFPAMKTPSVRFAAEGVQGFPPVARGKGGIWIPGRITSDPARSTEVTGPRDVRG